MNQKFVEVKNPITEQVYRFPHKYVLRQRIDILNKTLEMLGIKNANEAKYSIIDTDLEACVDLAKKEVFADTFLKSFERTTQIGKLFEQPYAPQTELEYLLSLETLIASAKQCFTDKTFLLRKISQIAKCANDCVEKYGVGIKDAPLSLDASKKNETGEYLFFKSN